ncbi:hypothetical protein NDU88_001057 [Pleurodeles waltl]|uniref:Uncharacterized protein n=1 Tax=Pleurodeles waltl TaxID=8319 RepID=A0AAV7SYW7_PLEWA|nr:hypothetical protein NDU88_001057 [Pleurodeles waltl]
METRGLLLSRLATKCLESPFIPAVRTRPGELVTIAEDIAATFVAYYDDLYARHSHSSVECAHLLLADKPLPALTRAQRDSLDERIMVEEIH